MMNNNIYPDELLRAFKKKEVILFVGNGLSIGAGLPTWYELINKLAQRIGSPLPPIKWATGDSLIDTAQKYVNQHGLANLVLFLQDELDTTGKPPSTAHEALPNLPISLIFTANFDNFLERTYQNANKQIRSVVRDNNIPSMGKDGHIVKIVKPYGDLNQPDTIVLARQQYERFFLTKPSMVNLLKDEMSRSTMLYLGWSHSDPYYNMVFSELLAHFGELTRPSYTVMFDISDEEKQELERKKIHVIQLSPEGGRTQQLTTWLKTLKSQIVNNSEPNQQDTVVNSQIAPSLTERLEAIHTEIRQQGDITRQNIQKTQDNILTHYDKKQEQLIAQIIGELNQAQASAVQEVVAALDGYQGDENVLQSELDKIQALLGNVKSKLDELDNKTLLEAANEILATVSEPQVSARHKLKLTIPLLGPFIGYESELELNQDATFAGLAEIWKELKNKLGIRFAKKN